VLVFGLDHHFVHLSEGSQLVRLVVKSEQQFGHLAGFVADYLLKSVHLVFDGLVGHLHRVVSVLLVYNTTAQQNKVFVCFRQHLGGMQQLLFVLQLLVHFCRQVLPQGIHALFNNPLKVFLTLLFLLLFNFEFLNERFHDRYLLFEKVNLYRLDLVYFLLFLFNHVM